MRTRVFNFLMVLSFFLMLPLSTVIADDEVIEKEEASSQESSDKPRWIEALKSQYQMTDETISSLKEKGLKGPQMVILAQLAKSSGKTIDQILAMRLEKKMGWGKIAKELGLKPSEIGHAVSVIRHEIKNERRTARTERKEERKERREQRREERKERKENKRTTN